MNVGTRSNVVTERNDIQSRVCSGGFSASPLASRKRSVLQRSRDSYVSIAKNRMSIVVGQRSTVRVLSSLLYPVSFSTFSSSHVFDSRRSCRYGRFVERSFYPSLGPWFSPSRCRQPPCSYFRLFYYSSCLRTRRTCTKFSTVSSRSRPLVPCAVLY